MKFNQFLLDFYFGHYNDELLRNYTVIDKDEKTDAIIAAFHELSKEYPPTTLEEKGIIPKELFESLKGIGFFGLSIPEAYGGLGLSLEQYLRIVEGVSNDMALGILSLAHLSIGTKGIVLFGNEEQKQKYLKKAASGEMIFCYALTEPKFGSDAKNIETQATLSEDGSYYQLNGTKAYITNANYAGGITLFAQLDPKKKGFLGAFIVETAWDGVEIGKDMTKMGLKVSSTALIHLKNVKVPVQNMLGKPGDGFKIAMTILNFGRLALGAASIGLMKLSIDDMLKRAETRKQFGVPIANYQLIQEKIIKAKAYSTIISAMTHFTATIIEDNPQIRVAMESAHTKLFSTNKAWEILYDAMQVAGGSGYLSTQPYEKRMRDFRVTTIFEGTTEIHSIYPPLLAINALQKAMSKSAKKYFFLLRLLMRSTDLRISHRSKTTKMAVRLIKKMTKRIRFLIIMGMFYYRKQIIHHQYFLRRITTLSVHVYGMLAQLKRIQSLKLSGKEILEEEEILEYFIDKSREVFKLNNFLKPSKLERISGNIWKLLVKG